jgi:glyoxylase-like metal-dependent hydrolase (beta-lactamase superfamily II)
MTGSWRRRAEAVVAVAVLVLAVGACSGSDSGGDADTGPDDGGSATTAPERATEVDPITTTTTTEAPQPALPEATVAARRAFFGAANVDSGGHLDDDQVVVSWFGIASLAVAFGDRVVLLDTAINNPGPCLSGDGDSGAPYVDATEDQLVALAPVAIFVGHGHSDHACDLGRLVADTGATLVGLPQHCDQAREEAEAGAGAGSGDAAGITCVEALAADSPFGTTALVDVPPLGDAVGVTAVRNLHSGRDGDAPCNRGGCEAVLYRFEVGNLSLVWNDTNGPISTAAPELAEALRGLPPSDVELGSILGLGVGVQGMRDPVDYAEALRVGELYPLHHDTTRGGGSAGFRPALEAEMAARPRLTTTLHWLQDPTDYLKPLVFPTT